MKTITKATAAIMAMVIALTGCAGNAAPEDNNKAQSDVQFSDDSAAQDTRAATTAAAQEAADPTDEYEVYLHSPITQVDNIQVEYNGAVGHYTGDIRGTRPEGSGTLSLNDNEFYKGEWINGYLNGQGEIQKVCDDGSIRYYSGECTYSQPSGYGVLSIASADGQSFMGVTGDFSSEDTLMYYTTDADYRLVDIGYISEGAFISYVDNDQCTGMEYIAPDDVEAPLWAEQTIQHGEYFGYLDENNNPNGYGYYRLHTSYVNSPNTQEKNVGILGVWVNGTLEGSFTEISTIKGQSSIRKSGLFGTKEVLTPYTESYILRTDMKDGQYCGDYALFSYVDYEESNDDKVTVIRKNIDTFEDTNTFTLCDDGVYRGTYVTEEYYKENGEYGYYKYRKACMKDDEGNLNLDFIFDGETVDGEYVDYDADGEMLDFGTITKNGRVSMKPEDKTAELLRSIENRAMLLLSVAVALKICDSMSGFFEQEEAALDRWVEDVSERSRLETIEYQENMEQFYDLKAEADELKRKAQYADEYHKDELTRQAKEKEEEAWSHHRSIFL